MAQKNIGEKNKIKKTERKVGSSGTKKEKSSSKNVKKELEVKETTKQKESSVTSKSKKSTTSSKRVTSTKLEREKIGKKKSSVKSPVKVAPKANKKSSSKSSVTKKKTTPTSKQVVSNNIDNDTSKIVSIKSTTKEKAKEKAIQKSRQANSNKKDVKPKKREVVPETSKLKKIVKKPIKQKKKTAIYISPSQLEKQNKRKFPWELFVIFVVILSIGFLGITFYNKFNRKNVEVNRTNSYDTLNAVALDGTDIISVGSSNFKHSTVNEYIKETAKAKIVKMNTSGDLIFEKAYDSKKSSVFNSLEVVSDGYIVVGSMAGDQENRNGKQLGLMVKYDKDGNLLWEKVFESSGNAQFLKIQTMADGYLVVGSSSRSSEEKEIIDCGALLFKYDFEGNLVWQQYYGNQSKAKFNSLTTVDNAIYVVGKNDDDLGVLVRYSLEGNLEWDKTYTYTDEAGFSDILYKNESLFVVGSKKILPNSIENEERKTSNTDALFIKYNLSGDIEFEKVFGGSNQDAYVALTTNRNYLLVVGYSNSTDSGLKIFTDGKKKTGILIKYDTNGDIERKAIYGGSNNDIMTDITTDNSNLYITSFSNSKDGNILTEFDNGKDSFGKMIKTDSRLRTLFVK